MSETVKAVVHSITVCRLKIITLLWLFETRNTISRRMYHLTSGAKAGSARSTIAARIASGHSIHRYQPLSVLSP